MYKLVLASGSPRRKELLRQVGLDFDIIPAKGEESSNALDPSEFVKELAMHKAEEVYNRICEDRALVNGYTGKIAVIGADTIVVRDDDILGKPVDRQDAFEMIRSLQGREHRVMTGAALICGDTCGNRYESTGFTEITFVDVMHMTDDEILNYVKTGESDDKAGSYGIQGRFGAYISGIRGDYNTVVGLPLAKIYHELERCKVINFL